MFRQFAPPNIDLSVVSAVFNEEKNIEPLVFQLDEVLSESGLDYEIILVDDGSTDNSLSLLKEMVFRFKNLKVIELQSNVGQIKALSAGMSIAMGTRVVMIDGDLQHDPKEILVFLEKYEEGYDLVATYRKHRAEPLRRKVFTWFGNHINRFLTGVDVKDFGSAFRLLDYWVVDSLKDQYGIVHYNTPKLYQAAKKIAHLPITQSVRKNGSTKWSLGALISYNFDFISVSSKPAYILITLSCFGICLGSTMYFLKLLDFFEHTLSVSAGVTLVFTSLQMAMLGLIWRETIVTQQIVKGVPQFIIKKIWQQKEETECS
jgi:glycosyltransferase involved in cell wall biosynthesis